MQMNTSFMDTVQVDVLHSPTLAAFLFAKIDKRYITIAD